MSSNLSKVVDAAICSTALPQFQTLRELGHFYAVHNSLLLPPFALHALCFTIQPCECGMLPPLWSWNVMIRQSSTRRISLWLTGTASKSLFRVVSCLGTMMHCSILTVLCTMSGLIFSFCWWAAVLAKISSCLSNNFAQILPACLVLYLPYTFPSFVMLLKSFQLSQSA
jgi:hypothetical protein